MKPSEKDRQPTDEGDLEQTKHAMERLVRKPRKPQGKTASKRHEGKKAAITSRTSKENLSTQRRAESLLSPAEQSAVDAWLEHRKRASPGTMLPGDALSAKKSRRPVPLKPVARRAAVTQTADMSHAADMSHCVPQTREVGVPEDICAGALPPDIIESPSSDLGMNRRTPLWDSSVAIDQTSSDPHTSHCPFTPRDPINVTESSPDGQKSVMRLFRRRAPVLPPVGVARRLNRLIAALVLLGAFNALVLALALTSGTQSSRSSATDTHGQLVVGEVKPQPTAAAEASPPAPVLAALPQQAVNPDRLSRTIRAPQPAAADRLPDIRSLRSSVREGVSERDIPMAGEKPSTASRAATISKRVLEQILDEEASSSPALGNTGIDDDTGVGHVDTSSEVSALTVDEASEQAGDEATDEDVATRSAAVATDVNMRARPDNAAAVITVVPGKSDVEVIGCDAWCEVVFAGKRGWIYHRFVGSADSGAP